MQNAIVIDKNGYKVEFVLAKSGVNENGETTDNIMHYTLKEGESVIYKDVLAALSMYAPQWTGSEWIETGSPPEPDIEALKAAAVTQTKSWVASELGKPMQWTDGKMYTVTLEKQNLLSAQLGMYMMNAQTGTEYPLMWNASGEACAEWTFENLSALSNAIAAHVSPIVAKQQYAEIGIRQAVNYEQIEEILQELA